MSCGLKWLTSALNCSAIGVRTIFDHDLMTSDLCYLSDGQQLDPKLTPIPYQLLLIAVVMTV
jgi:hypothetical protein